MYKIHNGRSNSQVPLWMLRKLFTAKYLQLMDSTTVCRLVTSSIQANQEGDDPFYCLTVNLLSSSFNHCYSEQGNRVLKSKAMSPSRSPSQDATRIASSTSSNITSSQPTNPEVTVQEDHKCNAVIYGIEECAKGTPRYNRPNHDLDEIKSIIAEGENSLTLYLNVIP